MEMGRLPGSRKLKGKLCSPRGLLAAFARRQQTGLTFLQRDGSLEEVPSGQLGGVIGAVLAMGVEGPLVGVLETQFHADGLNWQKPVMNIEDELAGEQGAGAVFGGAVEDQRGRLDNDIEGGGLGRDGFGRAPGGMGEALKGQAFMCLGHLSELTVLVDQQRTRGMGAVSEGRSRGEFALQVGGMFRGVLAKESRNTVWHGGQDGDGDASLCR